MEKSTKNKLLIGAGILALIGIYLYNRKKSTTTSTNSSTSKTTSNVNKVTSTSVKTPVVQPTSTSTFDTIFNAGTQVASTLQSNTPSVVTTTKTTPSVISTQKNPIVVVPPSSGVPTPIQSSQGTGTPGSAGGSFDMAKTKDSTLENSNATLGSLTTAGHYWGPDSNPTGYVNLKYPPTTIIEPNSVLSQEQTNQAADIYAQNYPTPSQNVPDIIDQNGILSYDATNQATYSYAQNYTYQQGVYSTNYYNGGSAGGGQYKSHLYGLGQGGDVSS